MAFPGCSRGVQEGFWSILKEFPKVSEAIQLHYGDLKRVSMDYGGFEAFKERFRKGCLRSFQGTSVVFQDLSEDFRRSQKPLKIVQGFFKMMDFRVDQKVLRDVQGRLKRLQGRFREV